MRKKKKKKNQLPMRVNILFLFVFLLFAGLILRLGIIQIVEGEKFLRYADATENVISKTNTPRGVIKDKKGNIIVDNEPIFNLVYTRQPGVSGERLLESAKLLATFIDKETDSVTERDLKDFYIVLKGQDNLIKEKITDVEREKVGEDGLYELLLDKITDEDLATITKEELEVAAIWREMNTGYSLSEQVIKEGVTKQEFAKINEHLSELDGIDVQADGERVYPYGDTLSGILGSTGKIPKENKDFYTVRGYDLNDEVGTSGLEEQYEDVLSGIKEKRKYVTKKSGDVIDEPLVVDGKSGQELILTVDMDFQREVEKIVEKHVRNTGSASRAYAVVVNPKTGEVLSLTGKKQSGGKMVDDVSSTYLQAFQPGSSVKGATVLTGFMNGVMQPGETIYDRRLRFPDGTEKGSYRNMGTVNDITALEKSSNVYMFYVGMRLAGYGFDCRCWTGDKSGEAAYYEAIQTYREGFHQFGLGVKTGIDLPYEATGYSGSAFSEIGLVMDYGIGQYDTFTPLQLAQYVSTIANNGDRMKLHLVKEIREANPNGDEQGKLIKRIEPEVLNRLNASSEHIKRVQQGFYRVVNGSSGTARSYYRGLNVAGKTGTAEVGRKGSGLENLLFVGYAPYDDPEIAFSVVVPNVRKNAGAGITHRIGQDIVKAYYELKDKPYTLNQHNQKDKSVSEDD
ncbi:peptidoglycan D,D-transpeptidase FtsI family protein [Pueribacillus sp. YX66]|uniref:peptidoglycan D,D-transpeptidase FtsI family protein n=1 Tax=Pueribacillus sp. YX66 TaxID=3229242 RepID=UPI00358D9143